MKKKTVRIYKLTVLLIAVAIFSVSTGFALRGWYDENISGKPIELEEYLENGEFRGVKVNMYDKNSKIEGYSEEYLEACAMFYQKKSQTIYVNRDKLAGTGKDLENLYHEYGHYLWEEVLSKNDRDDYIRVWKSTGTYTSVYAMTDGASEDFAESYSAYLVDTDKLHSKKYNFMNKLSHNYPGRI
jgi:hypothetical protein